MSAATLAGFSHRFSGPLAKGAGAAVAVLMLQIPLIMVKGLLREREATRAGAVAEVAGNWGHAQDIAGPFFVVPYRYTAMETGKDNQPVLRDVETSATFLPAELNVTATTQGETRYRGIYEVPVYSAEVAIRGAFDPPDFSGLDAQPNVIHWDRAAVVFHIADTRAIQDASGLTWHARELPFTPGMDAIAGDMPSIRAVVGNPGTAAALSFAARLTLRGSTRLQFAPVGRVSHYSVKGNWPDPSFRGLWLPTARGVSVAGYTASWQIPYLGRKYPQIWRGDAPRGHIMASLTGVDFLQPVDTYRQAERSLKYDILFTALIFAVIWMMEVLLGLRMHIIQYFLIGGAICMFYLLELSLAEHIGFAPAYAVAACMVVGLVLAYGWSAFGTASRAVLVGGIQAGLYAYLYVLLQIQDYSLLVGSLGLFAILVAVMMLTRKLDWYALSERQE